MDGNLRKKAQMRLTFSSLPSFFRTAPYEYDRSPFSILHFDSGCKLDESGGTSEQQVRQRRGTRQMASLFRQLLSPLHLSVELSIVLSIERPGYLQKAHSSHWKYRTGRRFGHQISLFHSPPPSLTLRAFLAQMASADG